MCDITWTHTQPKLAGFSPETVADKKKISFWDFHFSLLNYNQSASWLLPLKYLIIINSSWHG